jgi:predicted membrane channel-forming protein YqfA (hemolysin III family)
MHPVSPYPNTVLAVWQLILIAVVALGGVAAWLGAVFYAAREPRARDHAAASGSPALDPAAAGEAGSAREQRAAA